MSAFHPKRTLDAAMPHFVPRGLAYDTERSVRHFPKDALNAEASNNSCAWGPLNRG